MVAQRHGATVDLDRLTLDDPEVYRLLSAGRTAGVFQFESALATDCLRNMKCDRFDDLVATNALLRPGPLDTGMHLVFINRKLGREKVTYPHPALREILEPTYGVITYQEQVMRIANVLAGFSLAEADVLRKAVGKKDQKLIDQELGRFIERALACRDFRDHLVDAWLFGSKRRRSPRLGRSARAGRRIPARSQLFETGVELGDGVGQPRATQRRGLGFGALSKALETAAARVGMRSRGAAGEVGCAESRAEPFLDRHSGAAGGSVSCLVQLGAQPAFAPSRA